MFLTRTTLIFLLRLNPYSIGRYSLSVLKDTKGMTIAEVLILILLEDTL